MQDQNIVQQFEDAYQALTKPLFRFVHFKTSDHAVALDITQETFLKFWKTLSRGESIQNPKAFLFSVAHDLIVDHYRKKTRRTTVDLENLEGMIFTADNFDDKLDTQQQVTGLLVKLRKLRPEYQDVLILYYIEEITVPEIAEMLNKSEGAVRVLIHRALKELKAKYD